MLNLLLNEIPGIIQLLAINSDVHHLEYSVVRFWNQWLENVENIEFVIMSCVY